MRLIDADQFGVISLQGKTIDYINGVDFILAKIDEAPTIGEQTIRGVGTLGKSV